MRREEICKLRLDEVMLDDAVPHLQIRPSSEGTVKTARLIRQVPLHREVLRLGFADYVAALRREGEELVFPELRPGQPDEERRGITKTGRPKLQRTRGAARVRGRV